MRRLAVSTVLVLLLAAPAPVLASGRDVAATHAAIAADYALVRLRVSMISSTQSKIESYKHKLGTECPNAGLGSPETEAAEPMSAEVAAALWSVDYGAAAGPIARFASVIRPLHWTSARFSHSIHVLASSLSGLARLRLPDICGDVRAWTASGFKAVPPHVVELNQQVEPLQLPEPPWKLIAPYERGRDASLVSSIRRGETKLAEAEFMFGQKDWYQVLETVGLSP